VTALVRTTWLPRWRLKRQGFIAPDETLPLVQTLLAGMQHVICMFGGTVLAPLLMGFDASTCLLFSGLGTLLFFLLLGGRLPSFVGSSFSFIAVVIAATGYTGSGGNPAIPVALGGIFTAGVLYAAIGVLVIVTGFAWLEVLIPPVVTGAIVAAIGLNLAPVAVHDLGTGGAGMAAGLITVLFICLAATYGGALLRRMAVLVGAAGGYGFYLVLANGFGIAPPIVFAGVAQAAWLGWPQFTLPVFQPRAMLMIAPVAIILVAENLGHVKAIAVMTGRNMDHLLGRAFLADGLATILAASFGGTGVTTYAENMGVMSITRNASTLVFVVAGVFATCLGLSPKVGAAIRTIPVPVLGGLSLVVFGMIAAMAGRIWVENKVDFSRPRNLLTVGIALVAGAGDLTVRAYGFSIGGIGVATVAAIGVYHVLRKEEKEDVLF
jgi:uracil-xanthine permease